MCNDACMSRTQKQILEVLSRELPKLNPHPAIVDAGCGDGALVAKINDRFHARVSGFDSSEYGLIEDSVVGVFAGDKSADIRLTLPDGKWPFEDSTVDVVVSNQVLEHVADLDQFCSEAKRVSRPGALGVHVFPTRHVLFEWHVKLPIVHRLRDHDLRSKVIEVFSQRGLGGYRKTALPLGVEARNFAESHADYLRTHTTYRTWREIADTFHSYGFRVSYRYTSMLLRSAFGGASKPLPPLVESALFPFTRLVTSVTVVTELNQEYRTDWKLQAEREQLGS